MKSDTSSNLTFSVDNSINDLGIKGAVARLEFLLTTYCGAEKIKTG